MARNSSEYRTVQVVSMRQLLDWAMRLRLRWLLAALLMPCAMAQTPEADRQREYQREQERQREEQQRRAQEEYQRQLRATEDARKRDQESRDETTKNIEDYRKRQSQAAPGGQSSPNTRAERPKLPAERNVLLGSWRVESGGQGGGVTGLGQGNGTDRNAMARELLTTLSNPCVLMFGKGITFAPSTYSIQALDGSVFQGSVDYSSTQKRVILAITQETWKTLPFEIESPNRIVWGRFGCALVRVGAPGANAAANATTAPGNARTGAASSSAATVAASGNAGAVVDGAAFRCGDGSLLFVSLCQGNPNDATCKLTELHRGDQIGKLARRADIAARVVGCESGGIRYGADDKPVFVR